MFVEAKDDGLLTNNLVFTFAVVLRNGCDSLWKTMNQLKPTLTAKKSYLMVKKFRSTYSTQLVRKIMLLLETITSAVEKAFCVCSLLWTLNHFRQLRNSGKDTTILFGLSEMQFTFENLLTEDVPITVNIM